MPTWRLARTRLAGTSWSSRYARKDGVGVYDQESLLLVKQLRAAGIDAGYLHDSASRRFEVKKSALATLAVTLVVGIASSASWDGVKALIRRRPQAQLTVTYVDLKTRDGYATALTATGDAEAVLQAIDRLRGNDDQAPGQAGSGEHAIEAKSPLSFAADGPDDAMRLAARQRHIDAHRRKADELMEAARTALRDRSCDLDAAERDARAAMQLYASGLDLTEDTEAEDEAHERLDRAGTWVRSSFGFTLKRDGTTYRETCPVSLAHTRIGFSIGGYAIRLCSLCGGDLSECDHVPGTAYLVPGGTADLGWCRVCLAAECDHTPDELHRVSVVAIIREAQIDEISLVDKPAAPGARILEKNIPVTDLQNALGDKFTPGDDVNCDKCLRPCAGLTKRQSPPG